MKRLSIVIPIYQNESNIPSTYAQIKSECEKHAGEFDYEIIFVDDGSTDNSNMKLRAAYDSDPGRIVLIRLSRNFGQVPAILAGFSQATGDCLMAISADLQDPPELLGRMFASWRRGHKLVIAVRTARDDGFLHATASRLFFGLMKLFVPELPVGGFDCWLMDRELRDPFIRRARKNSFFQGHLLSLGYKPVAIFYRRRKRELGKSQYTLRKKLHFFKEAFVYLGINLGERRPDDSAAPPYLIADTLSGRL